MKLLYKWCAGGLLCFLTACHLQGKKEQPKDSSTSGVIHISVDETFRPVMEEEIKVFESSYPNAKIIAEYKPEADCFKDLQHDGTRMIFVTRKLTKPELDYYTETLQFEPASEVLAYDAVAVVVNQAAPDSLFTRGELRAVLQGKFARPYTAVFDGLNSTSTVRFALDSILRGESFDKERVFAAKNSTGVIEYVVNHPDAIGFVGVSWIGNREDSVQVGYLKHVRMALLLCEKCKTPTDAYIKPYQEFILTSRYPFTRGLYYILKENYTGLGRGFAEFMKYERGQLIFRRAYLAPAILPFIIRRTEVRH